MAETYFGYQPQAREAQINWNDVATEVSNNITGAIRERQEKKEAIKQASRDYTKTLNSVEQGQHATANQWWLQAANQAQEVMLMQDRLLQNGQIKLSEYTMMRQNLVDGTDNMIKVFEDFKTTYAEKLARAQGSDDELGASQKLESWAFEQVQNFFDFDKSGFLVNPDTGSVSIGMLDPDGNIIGNPNDLQSASTFNSMVQFSADQYDLEAATTEYVGELGIWEEIDRRYGGQNSKGLIEKLRTNSWITKDLNAREAAQIGLDSTQMDMMNMYLAGEDLFVKDIMSNVYQTSSILTENLGIYTGDGPGSGEPYEFTRDKSEAGGNLIYVSTDNPGGLPQPEYTDEQKEDVANAIRTSVRSKLDVEVETTVVSDYTAPSGAQIKAGNEKAFQTNAVTNVRKLYSGNEAQIKEAEEFLRSINPSIQSITRDDTGVVITFVDDKGNIRKENLSWVDAPNNSLMDERQWVTGATNFFLPTANKIMDIDGTITASGLEGMGLNVPELSGTVTSATTTVEKENIRDTVLTNLPKDLEASFADFNNVFIADDETETVKNLESVLASMPGNFAFDVTEEYGGSDITRITYKVLNNSGKVVSSGELAEFDLDGMTTTTQSEYLDKLKDVLTRFYLANASLEQQASDFGTRRGTVERGGAAQQGELD